MENRQVAHAEKHMRISLKSVNGNVKLMLLLAVADKVSSMEPEDRALWLDEFPKQFRPVAKAYMDGHRRIRKLIEGATVKTIRKRLQEALHVLESGQDKETEKSFGMSR